MYCTGGIRCERATALLDQLERSSAAEGGDFKTEGVVMVRGGIERYVKTFPEGGYWKVLGPVLEAQPYTLPLPRPRPLLLPLPLRLPLPFSSLAFSERRTTQLCLEQGRRLLAAERGAHATVGAVAHGRQVPPERRCEAQRGRHSDASAAGDKACDGQEAMARDLREAGELLDRGAGADEVTAWALGQRKLAPE